MVEKGVGGEERGRGGEEKKTEEAAAQAMAVLNKANKTEVRHQHSLTPLHILHLNLRYKVLLVFITV